PSLPSRKKPTSLPSEMASSSHQRVDGDANIYFDNDGNPLTTVIAPRNDIPRKDPSQDQQIPMDTDEHIDAVN
ncbi:hypothetical protein A2U01_0005911, partial [Trifolium medium]|nr:hypothetical protein [Trifolium medium]